MKTALLAAYEKDDALRTLARTLLSDGWTLMGSAGTAKFLSENGCPCSDVAALVGPPILGHRVVTLAREIYAGLLSRPEDEAEMAQAGIPRIDLVYVTLYPLEDAIRSGAGDAAVIEKTDIGGPTLLRAAAKGRRFAISNARQIDDFGAWIRAGSPEESREELVTRFAAAAERTVAEYAAASASYWEARSAA